MISSLFRCIGLVAAVCLLTPILPAKEPVRVFLFAGQSNMEGADTDPKDVAGYPPFRGVLEPPVDVRYSYQLGRQHRSDGWTALTPVAEDFGPELSFAHEMRKYSDAPIAIIKDAWGGTTLVNDWAPDGGDAGGKKLYSRFLTQVHGRLAELKEKGEDYRIEALMWHQGENDMFHAEGRHQYEQNLGNFIARLRKDLEVPDLKVFIGEISTKGVWGMDNRGNVTLIRNAQHGVVDKDPKVFFVPTSHHSFKVGNPFGLHYHFGSLGQLEHGVAYARHFLRETGVELKSTEPPAPKTMPRAGKVKLFILGGQRNMEGEEAWLADLKEESKGSPLLEPQKALFQYSLGNVHASSEWKLLGPVDYLGSFGPELSFGRAMVPMMKSGEVLAIYKFTDSGSQSLDWLPEGSPESYRDRYQAWISGIKRCRDDLIAQGYECEIPAVFWHCGENDRALEWMAKKYAERFQTFMNATRRDLALPELKWVLTEQPMIPKSISGEHRLHDLNSDLEALSEKDPHLTFVATADLPHRPVLFGTEGIIALGERMAETWKKVSAR